MKYIKLFELDDLSNYEFKKGPELKIGNCLILYLILKDKYTFRFFSKGYKTVFWIHKDDVLKFIKFLEDENEIFEVNDYIIQKNDDGIKIYDNSQTSSNNFYIIDKKYIPDLIYFLKNPTLQNDMKKYNLFSFVFILLASLLRHDIIF